MYLEPRKNKKPNINEINNYLKKLNEEFHGTILGFEFNFSFKNMKLAENLLTITNCTIFENNQIILKNGIVEIENPYLSYLNKIVYANANVGEIRHLLWYSLEPSKPKSKIKIKQNTETK